MRFIATGKTIIKNDGIFNEVDVMPKINDIYTTGFGFTFIITNIYNRYDNCYSVELDNDMIIDCYYDNTL